MYIEIRAGEGGDDAKLLVREMFDIYIRVASRKGFALYMQEAGNGYLQAYASGPGSSEFFRKETGGHRWQRVPPNERRGRVHTSTVTVAALEDSQVLSGKPIILEEDIKWEFFRAGGKGGQKQNKTSSGARLRYGDFVIESREERSQKQNRRRCIAKLEVEMANKMSSLSHQFANLLRKQQVGSGMRGDKIRTYRTQDNLVTDHRSGRKCQLSDVARGNFDGLK